MRLSDRRDGERRDRPPPAFVLLREIDADTPVHRLWAGTKILAAAAISVVVSFRPHWGPVGVLAALLVAGGVAARVPLRALPRPPRWFWILLVVGGLFTLRAGGSPVVTLDSARIGLGGLDAYTLFVAVSVLLLGAGALIGWTTPLGEIGPAVGRLLAPLRLVRLPVEEWATTVALSIRGLPLVMGEVRTLLAARRLRPETEEEAAATSTDRLGRAFDEAGDILAAAVTVSLRRAAEMGEAITARGGASTITARATRPQWRDALALALVAGGCALAWLSA